MTRADLAGKILRVLQRDSSYAGMYDDEKVNDAIEDCLDFVAANMILSDDGWMSKTFYLDTTVGQKSVELPTQIGVINSVRYLSGDTYILLSYDDGAFSNASRPSSSFSTFPTTFKITGNKLVFPSALSEAGSEYLEINACVYPNKLVRDGDLIDPQFDKAAIHYIKWRAARQLVSITGKAAPDWIKTENEWAGILEGIIARRIKTPQFIREFE
jgi:hypothetical protein